MEPERIRDQVRDTLADSNNRLLLSAASSWEIAIKHALGRLALPDDPIRYVPEQMRLQGVEGLAIEHAHALAVATLPAHHNDPFDRLLVAQAHMLSIPIITADPTLQQYGVATVQAT